MPASAVACSRESLSRLVLVAAPERQQAFAAQAVDFRHIKADPRLVDAGDRAVEMGQRIGGAPGAQQHLGGQADEILRQRTGGRRARDFRVDQARGIGDAGADRAGPGGKQQAAGAPRQQSELLRQRRRAAAGREGAITIAGDLKADAEIVKRVGKRVGMIERLGKRKPTRDALCCLLCLAGHLQRHRGADVGANAGIVAAEGGAKMTVALHVIGFDTDPAVVQSCRHIAAEKSRGPRQW